MIENWYNECINTGIREYETATSAFVIYKGFKISKLSSEEGVSFNIRDVRKKDFYTDVIPEELEILKEKGFVEGAKHMEYWRNRRRQDFYQTELNKLFMKLRSIERNFDKDPKMNTKRKRIANEKIIELGDLHLFYTEKCREYEEKIL